MGEINHYKLSMDLIFLVPKVQLQTIRIMIRSLGKRNIISRPKRGSFIFKVLTHFLSTCFLCFNYIPFNGKLTCYEAFK